MRFVILNFHGVGPVTRPIDHGEMNCWLETNHFEAVLKLIRGHRHVRLTFDDGNASDTEIALPLLLQHSLSAAFFICSARVDQPTFLRQAQISTLLAQGMVIGSHGANHLAWRSLPSSRLTDELMVSKKKLEEICGTPIDQAACPFGSYDRRVLKILHHTGYRIVYTSDGGTATGQQWLQARTTITRSTPMEDIQKLIANGPNYLLQTITDARKLVKRLR